MRPDRLREARLAMGHTQESLAQLLDVPAKQISRYENGENKPGADVLMAFSQELHVSADWLLGLSDDSTPADLIDPLSPKERAAISDWRKGDRLRAIKSIIEDDR